jgi:Protein of unknown function (DUF3575)
MRVLISILFILFFLQTEAQRDSVNVKICPLALIDDISFPTIQAGVEWRFSKNLSWYNEAGIKYRQSFMDAKDSSFIPSKGFKIKTELRYYPFTSRPGIWKTLYAAGNLFFTRDQHNTKISFRNILDSLLPEQVDVFGVKKTVWGANLVVGIQYPIDKHFLLDGYIGAGFRNRHIETLLKEFNAATNQIESPIDLNIPSIRNENDALKEGRYIIPNFTLGVRICYRL